MAIVEIQNAPIYRVALTWNPTAYRRPAAAMALAFAQSAAERELLAHSSDSHAGA